MLPGIVSVFFFVALSVPQSGLTEDPVVEKAIELATEARYEQALKMFNSRLEEEPESALLNYYVGLTHLFLGEKRRAVDHLEKAIAGEATFPQVYYWCAQAHLASDELEMAEQVLKSGVEQFPRNRKLLELTEEVREALGP